MPTTSDERMSILRMLEQGKLSAEEAGKLLDALSVGPQQHAEPHRNERIRVAVSKNGVSQVNIALPMELARIALRFIPPDALSEESMPSPKDILRLIEEGVQGPIIDISKEDENVRIQMFLE